MKAKKSLGQNFLIDKNIINKIVNEIPAKDNDLIIEIGPGKGALTKNLINKNAYVLCYELDTDLKDILDDLESNKVKIIYKDFLKTNILDDVDISKYDNIFIVGNLPYYITTPIIEHVIASKIKYNKFTIMIQKEVADRFLALPGNKAYGYMTLVIDYYFDIKRVCNVARNSFRPIPNVDSTVVNLIPKNNKNNINEEKYFSFLKDCFNQKRKTLKNNLKSYDWEIIEDVLKSNNYSESVRAEQIPEHLFIDIYKKLFE